MTSSKPEFVIVPGGWHSPSSFGPTTDLLEEAGFIVHGVHLPSVGALPHHTTFDLDASQCRNTINSVLAKGKDVVLIMHSYGGTVGSEALRGYVEELEAASTKKRWGRVVRLVYCAAFLLPEGGSLLAALRGIPLPWFIIEVSLLSWPFFKAKEAYSS